MGSFRRFRAWEKAHELTLAVYRATSTFPSHERFGLVAQLRRSASFIPANFAEGVGRRTERDKGRFLSISVASAYELDYHLLLARDLHYLKEVEHEVILDLLIEVRKMLSGLLRALCAGPGQRSADR